MKRLLSWGALILLIVAVIRIVAAHWEVVMVGLFVYSIRDTVKQKLLSGEGNEECLLREILNYTVGDFLPKRKKNGKEETNKKTVLSEDE